MTLGEDQDTAAAEAHAGNGASPPEAGRTQRVSARTLEVITAYANKPTKEIQAALKAEGIAMGEAQIRRARWYYLGGGNGEPAQVPKRVGGTTGIPGVGRKPSVPMGAFQVINDHHGDTVEQLDEKLRRKGYILSAEVISMQRTRARARVRRAEAVPTAPKPGTQSAAIVDCAIRGLSAKETVKAIRPLGFRGVSDQTVYQARSQYRPYVDFRRQGKTNTPITRSVPAAPAPAARAPLPVPTRPLAVDTRADDKNKLRAMLLRVGLDVGRDVIAELEHILEKTESRL